METINHECYVSLEVAKLLEKAGFDWKEYFVAHSINEVFHWEIPLHIAQKWLREVKKVSVEAKTLRWVNRYQDGKYTISYIHELWPIDTSVIPNKEDKFNRYTIDCVYNIELQTYNIEFQTYEEALDAGIKKALEIILEKGE